MWSSPLASVLREEAPHRAGAQGDEASIESCKVEQADNNEGLPVGWLQRARQGLGLLHE